jgi:Ca2+-binding RTX toxin-like protein
MGRKITGTASDENLIGGTGDDRLYGRGGNDRLDGGLGADLLDGGDGDDVLEGGAGADTLIGGLGFDTASYSRSLASVWVDLAAGSHSGDALGDSFAGIERFELSAYDDGFSGSAGADQVIGLAGNDNLSGNLGDDLLDGGDGDDRLAGGAGADRLIGGNGIDIASYAGSMAAVAVDLSGGGASGDAAGDSFSAVEVYELSAFEDRFIGGETADTALGLAGADALAGGGGDDSLDGGEGDDVLNGGTGGDRLAGGGGFDTADYGDASAAARIDLRTGSAAGAAAGDTYESIERFVLTGFADTFAGAASPVSVEGGGGRDFLTGSDGNDVLDGGDDHDLIDGGRGADTLIGGGGTDRVSYFSADTSLRIDRAAGTTAGAAAGDTYSGIEIWSLSRFNDAFFGNSEAEQIEGGDGNDFLIGGGGADVLIGDRGNDFMEGGDGDDILLDHFGNDELNGGDGDDLLNGGTGDDNLGGGQGRDTLVGEDGNDLLLGQDEDDLIYGNEGDDRIYGGDGNDLVYSGPNSGDGRGDVMDGGAGSDTFAFLADWSPDSSRSVITGFDSKAGGDKVDLSLFVGGGRTVVTHTVDAEYGASTLVQVDLDRDGSFDFGLLVQGVHDPLGDWLVTNRALSTLLPDSASPSPGELFTMGDSALAAPAAEPLPIGGAEWSLL